MDNEVLTGWASVLKPRESHHADKEKQVFEQGLELKGMNQAKYQNDELMSGKIFEQCWKRGQVITKVKIIS